MSGTRSTTRQRAQAATEHVGELYFQQDSAPPRTAGNVRQWFTQMFPGRWVGSMNNARSPNPPPHYWPPRSPDLTPLDFALWAIVKDGLAKIGAN